MKLQFINVDGQVPYDGHYDLHLSDPVPRVGEYVLDYSRRFVVLRVTYDYNHSTIYVNVKREEPQ